MSKGICYIIIVVVLFACSGKTDSGENELLVFCAASLTNVIGEISEEYNKTKETKVQLNFASSGTLARQIEHGAKPAIYISANEKWVDYLIGQKLLEPASKSKVAGNSLVLIVPLESTSDSFQFENNLPEQFAGRLAMGDPKHVPAGEYAWQAIENVGFAEVLQDRILPAKDVRSALMVVELGVVEMGIVYKTDALKSGKVKIVAEIPTEFYSPVGFYTSILKGKNTEQSQLFYKFLTSKEAKAIWKKHGFYIE